MATRTRHRHNLMMAELFRIKPMDAADLSKERQRVQTLLSTVTDAKTVYEVGSTAVPGLIGKQDLDFLVLVPAAEFVAVRSRLDEHFRRNPDQLSTTEYQGYTVESALDVAIQLTIEGGQHDTFLEFLALLRGSPVLREQYNQLKVAFDGQPMQRYREAKHRFIETALAEDGSGWSVD